MSDREVETVVHWYCRRCGFEMFVEPESDCCMNCRLEGSEVAGTAFKAVTFIDAEQVAGLFDTRAEGSDFGLPAAIWREAARLVRSQVEGAKHG